MTKQININVNNFDLIVNLESNSSAETLYNKLSKGEIKVKMKDYGNMEKVGKFKKLPKNDTYLTTKPGDLVLYLGFMIVLYYDTNAWDLTPLGHVINCDDLKSVLGHGTVTATYSIIK